MLAQLHEERELIERALISLERLSQGHRRRGRPPLWMKDVEAPPKRGRPPGRKNKSKENSLASV